jgi:hypothetical protein
VKYFVCLIAVISLQASIASSQNAGYYPKGGPDLGVENVSMIRLIANPQEYDGKRIRITGFLRIEFEGDAIYLHREDFDYGITKDALWIDIPRDMTEVQRNSVNNGYVLCTGTFHAGGHGHMGLFSAEIGEITRLEPWMRRPRSQPPDSMVPVPPVPAKPR